MFCRSMACKFQPIKDEIFLDSEDDKHNETKSSSSKSTVPQDDLLDEFEAAPENEQNPNRRKRKVNAKYAEYFSQCKHK